MKRSREKKKNLERERERERLIHRRWIRGIPAFRLLVAFYARAEWKAKAAESHPCLDPHSFLSKRRDLLGKATISDPRLFQRYLFTTIARTNENRREERERITKRFKGKVYIQENISWLRVVNLFEARSRRCIIFVITRNFSFSSNKNFSIPDFSLPN